MQFRLSISSVESYLWANLAYLSRGDLLIFFHSAASSVIRHTRKDAYTCQDDKWALSFDVHRTEPHSLRLLRSIIERSEHSYLCTSAVELDNTIFELTLWNYQGRVVWGIWVSLFCWWLCLKYVPVFDISGQLITRAFTKHCALGKSRKPCPAWQGGIPVGVKVCNLLQVNSVLWGALGRVSES